MKALLSLFLLVSLVATPQGCNRERHSGVLRVLDSWSSRKDARAALLSLGPSGLDALQAVAKSEQESHLRRSRAITLLATFQTASSIQTLGDITWDKKPIYRCLALQALAELRSKEVLPILMTKLADQSTCMTILRTDPPREHEVFVSDEAVRALELVTGVTLEEGLEERHRATQPWYEWWSKQKTQ